LIKVPEVNLKSSTDFLKEITVGFQLRSLDQITEISTCGGERVGKLFNQKASTEYPDKGLTRTTAWVAFDLYQCQIAGVADSLILL
jgi:hypothetical protein